MSTIPAGLRADYMRQRMEDKATITTAGGLYVGGTTSTSYMNPDGSTTLAVETEQLPPGPEGYPLVSNGPSTKPSYQQITSSMIANGSISKNKVSGLVTTVDGQSTKTLSIRQDPNDSNVLEIKFYTPSV